MILKVAKLGVEDACGMRSREVDAKAVARGDYEPFLSDLEDTMREYDGTGIAAPQVFTPLRVFLYEVHPEKRKRKEPEVPLTAYFNATYEPVGEEIEEDSEGCLSVPFLWGGVVPRFADDPRPGARPLGQAGGLRGLGFSRARPSARDRSPGRPRLSRPHAGHEIARLHGELRLNPFDENSELSTSFR